MNQQTMVIKAMSRDLLSLKATLRARDRKIIKLENQLSAQQKESKELNAQIQKFIVELNEYAQSLPASTPPKNQKGTQ